MPLNAEKVRQLREKKGLTLADAAKAAGLTTPGYWSDVEQGRRANLTIATLERIAAALGVTACDLLAPPVSKGKRTRR